MFILSLFPLQSSSSVILVFFLFKISSLLFFIFSKEVCIWKNVLIWFTKFVLLFFLNSRKAQRENLFNMFTLETGANERIRWLHQVCLQGADKSHRFEKEQARCIMQYLGQDVVGWILVSVLILRTVPRSPYCLRCIECFSESAPGWRFLSLSMTLVWGGSLPVESLLFLKSRWVMARGLRPISVSAV